MNVVPRKTSAYLLALAGLCAAAGAAAAEPQRLLYQPLGNGEGPLSTGATPWALTWLEQKVWAADGATRDYLGTTFALSGEVALSGAPYARGAAGNYQGAAYVFMRSDGVWTQAQKLVAADGVANASFGNSVALEGDTALLGATGTGSAVYVFSRGGDGSWAQTQKLMPSDVPTPPGFGAQLALDGDLALISAPSATVDGNAYQGKVYVFHRADDGSWSEVQQLSATEGAPNLYFGSALALQDGQALIGANGATVNGLAGYGAVYAFAETDAGFVQTQRFSSSEGAAYTPFGKAIALSGERALITASSHAANGVDRAGAAYYFIRSAEGWTEVQKLVANDAAAYAAFGQSVALLGPTAVIGASGATIDGAINQGAAYVFTDVDGSWIQTDKRVASDGVAGNNYGWQVAFDGHTLASTALAASINGATYAGAIYLYERSGGDPHTVTPVVASGLGTIDPEGPQTVDDTASIAFTLTPAAGYRLDGVGGNCDGVLDGDIYTTAPITADCTVEVRFALRAQTVTPSVVDGHGTIGPDMPQTVDYGDTLSFTLTPEDGYVPGAVGGSCGGTLDGDVFTTAPILADCTVEASFRPAQHTVTPSVAGGHGTVSPDTPQTVADGASAVFTLTPEPGYAPVVGGSCGGTLADNVYTTAPVIEDCTVEVGYTAVSYTVTPRLATGNGLIAPGLPQTVGYGAVLSFTLMPDAGYQAAVAGSCGGTLEGDTFTTAPISADCTVEASFTEIPIVDAIFADGFD